MKKHYFLIGFFIVFVVEIVSLVFFAVYSPDLTLDTVAVNEVVQSVEKEFYEIERHNSVAALDYVVLNSDDIVIYRTKAGYDTRRYRRKCRRRKVDYL